MKFNNELYDVYEVNNFKELITATVEKYGDNIAYKFKKNLGKENEEVVEKTYKEIKNEVEGFSTALLNLNLEGKKIAVIGNNRYEWCVSYLAITTGNMIVVPLDKALPEGEIENLVKISGANAVIFEDKYAKTFEKIKENNPNIEVFVNMDAGSNKNGIYSFKELEKQGEELIKQGNDIYNKVEIDNSKIKDYSSAVQYSYNLNLNLYKENTDNTYLQVNPNQLFNNIGMGSMIEAQSSNPFMDTSMMVSQYDVWTEMLDNQELLESQYDVVTGKWPENYNEVVLIIGKNNEISEYTTYSLGLKDQDELLEKMEKLKKGEKVEDEGDDIYSYDDFLNLSFKILLNTDYYEENNGIWVNKSKDEKYLKEKLDSSEEIKIVGIIRPKEEAVATSISGAIGYTSDLKEYVINKINNTEIAIKQKENPEINVFTGTEFISNSKGSFDYSTLSPEQQAYMASLSKEELAEVMAAYSESTTATYESNLETMGAVDLNKPSMINIYPKNFEAKEEFINFLEDYNERMEKEDDENKAKT